MLKNPAVMNQVGVQAIRETEAPIGVTQRCGCPGKLPGIGEMSIKPPAKDWCLDSLDQVRRGSGSVHSDANENLNCFFVRTAG
jgi:hypothetical protein